MVGAIIVYNDRIIGEGYHKKYGQAHAEINALNAVRQHDKHLIQNATLYVSLEPCSHTGKTPPCAERIVAEGIKKVVIGCEDPHPIVAGNGIKYLKDHGIHVTCPVLEQASNQLIAKFKANLSRIPYVILKWAQSQDLFMSNIGKQTWLSNPYSKILAHKWRSEVDAIMVGKNTWMIDNPSLDVRDYSGESPIRVLMDSQLIAEVSSKKLPSKTRTIILNQIKESDEHNNLYLKIPDTKDIESVLKKLFSEGITSILVEGGSKLIESFIKSGYWHEARVIKTKARLTDGVPAPKLDGILLEKIPLKDDIIYFIKNPVIRD